MKRKLLIFDAGPIISMGLNGLLPALTGLKENFGGEFAIPHQVRKELVDTPFRKHRFQFEALQIMELIRNKTLKVYNLPSVRKESNELLDLANNIYAARGQSIRIVHGGEIEAIALAMHLNAEALIIDERTTRYLLEKPAALRKRLERKLHTHIEVDRQKLDDFRKRVGKLPALRSTELIAVGFEDGVLDHYLPGMKNGKRILISSLLWALKLRGCAISDDELHQLIKLEAGERI
ncbi:MAG: hypothetical protein ABIC95_04925 [archaeon]